MWVLWPCTYDNIQCVCTVPCSVQQLHKGSLNTGSSSATAACMPRTYHTSRVLMVPTDNKHRAGNRVTKINRGVGKTPSPEDANEARQARNTHPQSILSVLASAPLSRSRRPPPHRDCPLKASREDGKKELRTTTDRRAVLALTSEHFPSIRTYINRFERA